MDRNHAEADFQPQWFTKFLIQTKDEMIYRSTALSIFGLFFSLITFLPLIILADKQHHSVTISNEALAHITSALNSNLYIHTCIGALCCTFPLFCDHIMDILMAKYTSTTIPQSCLILSIAIPSIVLYQASLHGSVSVGMPLDSPRVCPIDYISPLGLYSCATSSQELLYFAAILSFHSHFSKSKTSKLTTMIFYFLFAVGILLTSFYNTDLIPRVMNKVGLVLVIVGLIGFYGSFAMRGFEQIYHRWWKSQCTEGVIGPSATISSISVPSPLLPVEGVHNLRENIYIYILIVNLSFRLLLFQFISHEDADSRAISGQPYYIMINTISVVFLSILNSRQLKIQYYQIQVPTSFPALLLTFLPVIDRVASRPNGILFVIFLSESSIPFSLPP
jgi:hypothetical protein